MRYATLLIGLVVLVSMTQSVRSADAPPATPAGPPAAPVVDPTIAKLDKAKATYQQKSERFKAELLKEMDAREAQARAKGDKAMVDKIKEERTNFAEKGKLPKVVSAAAYESRMKGATADLDAAYTVAIKEFVKLKKDDQATALDKERTALRTGADVFSGWVDLTELAVVENNRWKREAGSLTVTPAGTWAILPIAYAPPEEYEIEAVVSRHAGDGCFSIGTIWQDHRFYSVVDAGGISGVADLDRRTVGANETTVRGGVFHGADPVQIHLVVKKTGVRMTADCREILKYEGKPDRLSDNGEKTPAGWLLISSHPNCDLRVTTLRLKAISGRGKVLQVKAAGS